MSSEIVTVNVTLNTFREEIFNKVDEIKTVAASALTLAKENQECTKSIRDEMTNRNCHMISHHRLTLLSNQMRTYAMKINTYDLHCKMVTSLTQRNGKVRTI